MPLKPLYGELVKDNNFRTWVVMQQTIRSNKKSHQDKRGLTILESVEPENKPKSIATIGTKECSTRKSTYGGRKPANQRDGKGGF